MIIGVPIHFTQEYLPTKRHRTARVRDMVVTADIEIKEPTAEEFPVAMIVTEYASLYEGAKSYKEIIERNDSDYTLVSDEIRTHNGKFYKAVRISYGTAVSTVYNTDFHNVGWRVYRTADSRYYGKTDLPFTEESITLGDNSRMCTLATQDAANYFLYFDGKYWEECGEPMYNITTFGLGHNHGGTGFFITYHYNPNLSPECYFNALERDEAIAYGVKTALGRGDTNDVDRIKNEKENIEVLLPEAIKRNPKTDHADGGDPFLKSLEALSRSASSATEAGFLAMAFTAAELAS